MELKNTVQDFCLQLSIAELKRMHQKTEFFNITYNSMMYLDIISQKQECTVTYLAELLDISKAGASSKVNELVKLGLIEKQSNEKDKRVTYLSLPPEIKAEYSVNNTALEKDVQKIETQFKKGEIEIFCKILREFGDVLIARYENE